MTFRENVISRPIIQEHYRDVTIDKIATKFQYSPEYTSRLIRETTGMTFTEILQRVRMEQAQEMLSSTNLPVATIAAEIGYEAPEHFNRIFKKRIGMTPSAFRERNRRQ